MAEIDRLLTRGEVERRVGLRRSSLYREMRQGRFPLPVRVGPRAVRWAVQIDRLLTRGEVERRVGLRRSSLYREMRQGRFPLPVRVGPRAVRWAVH